MEKSDFDQLLERYLTGQVNAEEKARLEAWLETMKTEDTTNLELTQQEETALFQKITSAIEVRDNIRNFQPQQLRKQKFNRWTLRIAASVALLVTISYVTWLMIASPRDPQIANQSGKMILNDGSLVWVKGSGKLAYTEKKDQGIRYAELSGEALFEIAKDPGRPFIIQCNDIAVEVLGTSFSLKAGSDSVVLKVLTGRVKISSKTNNSTREVTAMEQVTYTHGNWIVASMSLNETTSITANTEYDMQFEDQPLAKLIERLQQKFDVTIELKQPDAASCRITADLTDHSLDASLQMVSEVLDISIEKTGATIVINGKGCK